MIKQIGTRREDVAAKIVGIAHGARRDDKNFRNVEGTFEQLLDGFFKVHKPGDKDGTCILQGVLVAGTGQRQKQNMLRNNIVMLDSDNGTTIPEFVDIVVECELSCLIWTTHSHMKTTSEVTEKALDIWVNKQVDFDGLSIEEKVRRYFSVVKSYTPEMVASITAVEKKMIPGGMTYVVTHAPMPRFRGLFILEEGFDFTAFPTHAIAMDTWTKNYANFCRRLGVHFDSTCGDPSRLMYLPRRPAEVPADQHEIIMIWGDCLTIERMAAGAESTDPLDAFTAPSDKNSKFVTPGLLQFTKHIRSFEMADCMAHYEPDGVRGPRSNGPGHHHRCPNEEQHSTITADDTAFMVTNASDGVDGPAALCMHTTCKEWSGGDRLMYLDKFAVNNGIKHANELMAFCPGAAQEQANTTARAETIAAAGDIDARIDALTPETPIEVVIDVLAALAQTPRTLVIDAQVARVAEKTERGTRPITSEYRRQRGIVEERERGDAPGIQRQPNDMENYRGPVMLHWHEPVQDQITLKILMEKNDENPFLYVRPEGGVVRLKQTDLGVVLDPIDTVQKWGKVISEHVTFQRIDETHGDSVYVKAPLRIIHELQGKADWDLPIIQRIIRVPVLGPDGTLRTEKGYDPATQTYVDPSDDFLPVPEFITDEILDAAIATVLDPIRDFPVSDKFDGSDAHPIKTAEVDADGFPLPNMERGRSSRVHALCMMIQPFVRDAIDGPCPAYHIGKAAAGTGAGYLADVVYYTTDGEGAVAQTMSESGEEFRKNITATLRSGATNIFIDNINRKVDSGHLAAALTAGKWKDRVLGVSETCQIPIKSTWMMAGNNLSFSHELMRRLVPIYMDANTKNPAHDRTGEKDFKHFPLQKYLKEHRLEIVQAIHILIMHWVRSTNMAWGSKRMNSFDSWAGVMSGIFEAAGIPGFLDNVPAYLNENDEDQDDNDGLISILYERFTTEDKFTPTEAFGVIDNDMSPVRPETLGIDGKTPAGKSVAFGRFLAKSCKGRTFTPLSDNPEMKVKLTKGRSNGGSYYKFVPAT